MQHQDRNGSDAELSPAAEAQSPQMLLGGTNDAPPPKRRRAARGQVTVEMNKKRSAGDGSRAAARDDEKKPDGVEVPERNRDLLPFLRTHWRPDLISLRSTPAPAVHIFARFENAP